MFVSFQAFSVLFFFMLFVLGIGSNIAMCSCITTVIQDQFPKWRTKLIVIGFAVVGFSIGLVYITPVSVDFLFSLSCDSIKMYSIIDFVGVVIFRVVNSF